MWTDGVGIVKATAPARIDALREHFGYPAKPFQWITGDRDEIAVRAMATTHLFNTLRMVWNNKMPVDARVGKVKLYDFYDPRTDEFLKEAMIEIYIELMGRPDVTLWMWEQLDAMWTYLNRKLTAAQPVFALEA